MLINGGDCKSNNTSMSAVPAGDADLEQLADGVWDRE